MNLLYAIVSLIYLLPYNTSNAQKLTAELSSAKLPTARCCMAALYDGDDTIYLFGGFGDPDHPDGAHRLNETLKYSISEDRIESAGQLPITGPGGASVMNKFKNIFYFSGYDNRNIYQYFPTTQTFDHVSSFEDRFVGYTVMKPDEDTAIIFYSDWNELSITSLNLNTLRSEEISRSRSEWYSTEAVWMEEYKQGYIFTEADILTYNWTTHQFKSLGKTHPILTNIDGVSDGRYIYLFGMLDNGTGIILFDPEVEEISYIQVENKPQLVAPDLIYVEKLNRIYVFGGVDGCSDYPFDNIYYISLDPMNETPTTTTSETTPPQTTLDPDIFNCEGRPDAVYPYPGECDKFIICRESHGYPYDCPEPLLFHPINRQCTWPDWVDCDEVHQI